MSPHTEPRVEVLYRYPPLWVAVGMSLSLAFATAIGVDNGRGVLESAYVGLLIAAVLGWRVLRMRLLDNGVALVSRGFLRTNSISWSEIREIIPQGKGGYAWAVSDTERLLLACVPPTITRKWAELRTGLLARVESEQT